MINYSDLVLVDGLISIDSRNRARYGFSLLNPGELAAFLNMRHLLESEGQVELTEKQRAWAKRTLEQVCNDQTLSTPVDGAPLEERLASIEERLALITCQIEDLPASAKPRPRSKQQSKPKRSRRARSANAKR